MDLLSHLGLFLGQTLIVVVGIIIILIAIAILRSKKSLMNQDQLEIQNIGERLEAYSEALKTTILNKKELKELNKAKKKDQKSQDKKNETKPRSFVLEFEGDVQASQVDRLSQEVSIVLDSANENDEVILKLESPGGVVHGYGLAAAQLMRIRDRKIPLTICVDKVAASGGYMMACTGDQILASPFAILGSIGVIAQVPNFHRLLKKHDVDYEEMTAGEYKRTVSLLGEITPKGKEKFTEKLEDTHLLFKDFVQKWRPQLEITQVANGDHWFGQRALELKLVDKIMTSDQYIIEQSAVRDVYKVELIHKKTFSDKLSEALGNSLQTIANGIKQQLINKF